MTDRPVNLSSRAGWKMPAFALKAGMTATVLILLLPAVSKADKPADWPMFGQNIANTAATMQSGISSSTAHKLKPKWTFTTGGDVSARAAVVNGVAYFPDWDGNLWAVNADNGKLVWRHQLSEYSLSGSYTGAYHSRTSPAVINGIIYVGTQEGGWLLAINASTGNLIWATQMDSSDPYAIVTTSPVVANGVVYTGVASLAEGATLYGITNITQFPSRGSAVAVDAATGVVKWQTYTVPPGNTGGGVWGSNPAVDVGRNALYISTGNNYTIPTVLDGNNEDSVLALDLTTGAVKWATKLVTWGQNYVKDGSDNWNVDCILPYIIPGAIGKQCPPNPGPDYDFGSAPNLITYQSPTGLKTIVGAGQKSGIYYALDPDNNGAVLWKTQVGPGSSLGGMEWGSASDGKRIYVQIANNYGLPDGTGNGYAGLWAALDPASGQVLWKTSDPNGAIDLGPMTVADDVVYASSMAGGASSPTMFALNAATGVPVWSFASGASVNAGATVVNGIVYWGSGYAHLGSPGQTGNNKFYAFSINGN